MKKKPKPRPSKRYLWVCCVFVLLVAGGVAYYETRAHAGMKPDYWPTSGWRTSTPEAQGMDSALLAQLFDAADGQRMHSMVLVRNGYIVAEAYDKDVDMTAKQHVFSVTKSFLSAVFGIAQHEFPDKLAPTDLLTEYFPELLAQNDKRKDGMRIDHLLKMTSGIDWPNDNEVSTDQLMNAPDWVDSILNRGMQAEPGTLFHYSNANPHLVSALLQKTIGKTTEAYARERLFGPLGISDLSWEKDPQGITLGPWGLRLSARDMAKFGLLYLEKGKWDGTTVVPKDWVQASTAKYINEHMKDGTQAGYGYYWWLRNENGSPSDPQDPSMDMFSAMGSGGQRIIVMPNQNMVAVFTGMNTSTDFFADKLIDNYILPAVKSGKSLPANPAGDKQLSDKIAAFKQFSDGSTGL